MIGGIGTVILTADHLSVSSASRSLSVTTGSDTFEVNPHANKSIVANGRDAETFGWGSGFGQESITGLLASGTSNDEIKFSTSMFWGQAHKYADPKLGRTNIRRRRPSIWRERDHYRHAHDTLTLNNVTLSTFTNHAGGIFNSCRTVCRCAKV